LLGDERVILLATKILLVDDEPLIIKGLKYTLEKDGYETFAAYNGEDALEIFQNEDIDLVLLDVMLPKMDGIAVCQRIRETSDVPIIMLTAKGEDMDKILGLEYGADDYMTKPFNILEVKMRIKTILRRAQQYAPSEDTNIHKVGDLELNVLNRSVTLAGKDIRLTAKEFDLMLLFITNPGRVFTREEILDSVWKNDYSGDARTVDVHIRRLREKIEQNPAQPEYIYTKWGVGYYFTSRES
jgi:DNA-binding response OmpR family regulator